jgi:hypothetical protein
MTLKHILTTILILLGALFYTNTNNGDCVYIRGGGFSGFWYYYGYLQKNKIANLANIANKPIYCYSSGCVAYVASISNNNNNNFTYLYDLAHNLVIDYNNNKINSYEVKEIYINFIANTISNIENYNLNILTSNYLGQCTIKTPTTISELIVALDETTNIPIITTKLNFSKKIDGICCITFINKCATIIELPYDYKIYRNAFNINLSYEDVIYFLTYINL